MSLENHRGALFLPPYGEAPSWLPRLAWMGSFLSPHHAGATFPLAHAVSPRITYHNPYALELDDCFFFSSTRKFLESWKRVLHVVAYWAYQQMLMCLIFGAMLWIGYLNSDWCCLDGKWRQRKERSKIIEILVKKKMTLDFKVICKIQIDTFAHWDMTEGRW